MTEFEEFVTANVNATPVQQTMQEFSLTDGIELTVPFTKVSRKGNYDRYDIKPNATGISGMVYLPFKEDHFPSLKIVTYDPTSGKTFGSIQLGITFDTDTPGTHRYKINENQYTIYGTLYFKKSKVVVPKILTIGLSKAE